MFYPARFDSFGQSIFGKLVLLQIFRDSVTDRGECRTLRSRVGAGAFAFFGALVIDIGWFAEKHGVGAALLPDAVEAHLVLSVIEGDSRIYCL